MCKETSLKEVEKLEPRYALAIVRMPVKQLATELSLHKAEFCARQNQGLMHWPHQPSVLVIVYRLPRRLTQHILAANVSI